ncbi:MAG: hypothetical protein QOG39_2068 [Acidimicrobiaceae bacterium]
MDAGYWGELLRPVLTGRRVIVTGGPVAGLVSRARLARSLGSERPFILGNEGTGTGELPTPDEAETYALDVDTMASTIMDAMRAGAAALADLPAEARAALDRYDPDRSALVLGSFLNELPSVAGRPCLAHRRPEWVALEDKVTVDELWDRAGVPRAPSEVVPARMDALRSAADRLDHGAGTVWVGDAREGFHGGGEYARWIRQPADVDDAAAFLAAHCDTARVMPFLEGIPCSVHGLVFADHVAAFRPIEMITLRRPGSSQLFYAGAASYWDPPADDRGQMRAAVRRVGTVLRDDVGFRGPFTIDGVMTEHGFRPTELNPRSGAGLNTMATAIADIPLTLLHDAVCAGLPLDFRPHDLEATILERADATRGGGTWRAVTTPVRPLGEAAVVRDGADYRWARGDERPDGWVTAGPSPLGSFIRFTLNPETTPVGDPVGPLAVAFYRFTDAELGTDIGPLEAAPVTR